MASSRTGGAQASRFQLPGEIPSNRRWNSDRHPELRPLVGPLTLLHAQGVSPTSCYGTEIVESGRPAFGIPETMIMPPVIWFIAVTCRAF